MIGASLVLNPPRLLGRFRGYPYEESALRHVVATSRFVASRSFLPGCAGGFSTSSAAS